MTAMGIAQVPGRDLRKVDTEAWPVLGQDTDPAAINAEVRELIERINAKIAAGELSERDQDLLRELVDVDGWERAHEFANATVNGSDLPEDAKERARALLARLPREVVEETAEELVELHAAGWVEGAARVSAALAEKVDQATTAEAIIRRVQNDAVKYAQGLVDGCAIGNGLDPDTGEPIDDTSGGAA